ncbi:ROK family protein [Bacillus sp. FJAT-49711]|uniref:ROK family protein n=1 Tax=Bacillus sp. FJAT-49711 TaxID=2833585 RepID=UPI001BC961A9|nr:ROK family protein [Bacillus sp. FJAT-49711]MBS4218762.1 ROK family protein [Bacillus sp. FJAT-49711]
MNKAVLGVDVGGTNIQIGLVAETGEIVKSKKYRMNSNSQAEAVAAIIDSIDDFVKSADKLKAIGIGLVGHINPETGVWKSAINIPISKPVPLAQLVSEKTKVPVCLDNDVNAATLAEMKWGIGKQTSNFIYVNVGTGIAMGIVENAKLIRGIANYAGEVGHMYIGQLKEGFGDGYLETICSGGGMVKQALVGINAYPDSILASYHQDGSLHSSTIFQAAQNGDHLAAIIAGQAIKGLEIGSTNIVNLFNPEHLVFGGGVFNHQSLLEKVRQHIKKNALPVSRNSLKSISITTLNHNDIGLLGAASIALMNEELS